MQVQVRIRLVNLFLVPIPEALTRPSTPLVLQVRERTPTPSLFPLSFNWDSPLSPSRSWGCVSFDGFQNFQKVIEGVKTHWIEEFFISSESSWNLYV